MKKKSKSMHILLWVLQILFAFYYIAGGIYMVNHYILLANAWALHMFPITFWEALGVLQVLLGIGLVLPSMVNALPKLISVSAIGLAVISLLGSLLFVTYTGSGILWAIVPAIFLSFVAYGRWSTKS